MSCVRTRGGGPITGWGRPLARQVIFQREGLSHLRGILLGTRTWLGELAWSCRVKMAYKFLQCNVNRSQQAQDLLIGYAREVSADFCIIAEPTSAATTRTGF